MRAARVDVRRRRAGRVHRRVGERLEHGFGGRVHRAPLPVLLGETGLGRLGCLAHPDGVQQLEDLRLLLGVHPSHHVGHVAPARGRGEQQRGQQLGRGGVPEVAVGHRAIAALGSVGQRHRHLAGPDHVRAASSGDHWAEGSPVEPLGSKHTTSPQCWRQAMVSRTRSVFTLVATTGPSQPRMAGMAKPVVFRLWVGPKTTTDCEARPPTWSDPTGQAPGGRVPAF